MDESKLKTEIKTWERNFKSTNGRTATVEDIKNEPAIAEKYKLYKKLTKKVQEIKEAKETLPSASKTASHGSLKHITLLAKPRASPSTSQISSSNPFSPQKNRTVSRLNPVNLEVPSNPFLTPSRNGVASSSKMLIDDGDAGQALFVEHDDASKPSGGTAMIKARKRLRGDPVTPTPRRTIKRARTSEDPGLPGDPFRNARSSVSPDRSDESDQDEHDTSFVDDSPVKPPAGGKGFTLLFQDARGNDSGHEHKSVASTSRLKRLPSINFTGPSGQDKDSRSQTAGPASSQKLGLHSKLKKNGLNVKVPKGIFPSKGDDVFDFGTGSKQVVGKDTVKKRALEVDQSSASHDPEEGEGNHSWSLLPPSPPPVKNEKSGYNAKGRAQGKDRKKTKLMDTLGVSDDPSDENSDSLNTRDWKPHSGSQTRQPTQPQPSTIDGTGSVDVEVEEDPTLRPRTAWTSEIETSEPDDGIIVELPEDLRRILAISPTRAHERTEASVVNDLLYGGSRTRRKDLGVYDAGELEETRGSTDGEDEWAGEGVAWEVAEL